MLLNNFAMHNTGDSLAAAEQVQSEAISKPKVVVHEPIRKRSQKVAFEASLALPETPAIVDGNSSSAEVPATPMTVPQQRRGPRKRGISSVGNMPSTWPAAKGPCTPKPQAGCNGMSATQSLSTAAAEAEKTHLKPSILSCSAPSNLPAGGAAPMQKSAQTIVAELTSREEPGPDAGSCEIARPPSTNAQKEPTSASAAGKNKSIFSLSATAVNNSSKHSANARPANPSGLAKANEGINKGVLEPFEAMGSFKVCF
mmetsp:Transcript_16588/g.35618  ORF Transcript_16588/g.35618 Transcript_16588/m.35618 type:complete len:256 (-) Transcript_16588:1395-2162(-)